MLYINALKAGLTIIERHSHSIDIYQEHERFTPLGSDATVVYGYKDLQFQNCLDQALQIQIFRQHDQLVATLVAQQHLKEYTLKFIVEDSKTHRIVRTLQDQKQIEQSIYLLNSPAD